MTPPRRWDHVCDRLAGGLSLPYVRMSQRMIAAVWSDAGSAKADRDCFWKNSRFGSNREVERDK